MCEEVPEWILDLLRELAEELLWWDYHILVVGGSGKFLGCELCDWCLCDTCSSRLSIRGKLQRRRDRAQARLVRAYVEGRLG